MTFSLSATIFTAVRALLKFFFTALFGAILARKGLLESVGARALSQCILNIFLPCLLFNKIVTGLDHSKLVQVGVLVITASIYMMVSLCFGMITRLVAPIPKGWKGGVLAASIFSNWGDLPIVLINTLTKSPPFTENDQNLGVAYVAVYMFVQNLVLFGFSGTYLIEMDFKKPLCDIEESLTFKQRVEKIKVMNTKTSHWMRSLFQRKRRSKSEEVEVNDRQYEISTIPQSRPSLDDLEITRINSGEAAFISANKSIRDDLMLRQIESGNMVIGHSLTMIDSKKVQPRQTVCNNAFTRKNDDLPELDLDIERDEKSRVRSKSKSPVPALKSFISRICSPPSIVTIISFVIAIVPQLKALFTVVPDLTLSPAPDGNPPLQFVLDIADFIGNASVPCSLLILGYSLSKLNIRSMPSLPAAFLLALLKLVILPIIAIAWMAYLTDHTQLVKSDELVLRLSIVLPAAVPTATALLYITQIFCGDREEEIACLSLFVAVQYLIVGFTLTITVVYTMNMIT